jgi:hypothetical protein
MCVFQFKQKEGMEMVKDGGMADDTNLESKGAASNSAGVDSIDAESLKIVSDAVVVQVSYHIAVFFCLTTRFSLPSYSCMYVF